MSDLIATAPVPRGTAPDSAPVEPVIPGDGWYPDIDMRHARAALRLLDGTVTDARLVDALLEAIAHTRDVLRDWRATQESKGATGLDGTDAARVGTENIQIQRYRRAVYGWALALLVERYRGYDTSRDGMRRADAIDNVSDEARRDAYWALSDLMKRRRVTVDLI
ncbi:MAG: head completion/stabilization protein [Burkholderia gladioli]